MTLTLKEWRQLNQKSQPWVARELGVKSATVVSRWERGVHIPQRDEMVALYVLTRGTVDPNSFYDLPDLTSLPQEDAA